jgi:hypothetical protein
MGTRPFFLVMLELSIKVNSPLLQALHSAWNALQGDLVYPVS